MKKNKPIALIILGILIMNQLHGQTGMSLYSGFGFPETLTFGARLDIKQFQAGIGGLYGILSFNMFTADISWHFAGSSRHTLIRPWYIKGGIARLNTVPYTATNLRVGREINIFSHAGLNFEVGILVGQKFLRDVTLDANEGSIYPSIGLHLFFRIL